MDRIQEIKERIQEAIETLKEMVGLTWNECGAIYLAIELMQDVSEGKYVKLPCKVGDTVYVDTRTFEYGGMNGKRYAEGLITSFAFGHREIVKLRIFSPYVKQYKVFKYPISAIGKTVFLTKEAAEKAKGERK